MPTPAKRLIATTAIAAAAVTLPIAACGGDGDGDAETTAATRAAPPASSFPATDGESLDALLERYPVTKLVVLPAGQVFVPGRNRFGFVVSSVAGEEVTDAKVALYAAHGTDGPARGPFPAWIESLETDPAFTAKTTADDPDAAKVLYASELRFKRAGEWRLAALIRDGDELAASRLPSIEVTRHDRVPGPGDPAPRVHTPTVADAGDVAEIDTRVPHSTMHADDLAQVLGTEPVVLVFATPALCQSRVCGPVVDVAEQVKRDYDHEAAFIYSEIYEDNDPAKGVREPVRAFNLPTEPWLFVIDSEGRIDTRIEGAFSVSELESAVERVVD